MKTTERIDQFNNGCLKEYAVQLNNMGFFTAPASTKYHGAYQGGLFDHSSKVAEVLSDLTKRLDLMWERKESPYIIGMLHDLCKADQYMYDIEKDAYVWNDTLVTGHGTKSVVYIQKLGIKLTEEEIACIIYHMGAFTDKEEWKDYNNAINQYPNVLWTHTADMVASKIMGV